MKKKYEVLREMPWMEEGFKFETDEDGGVRIISISGNWVPYDKAEVEDMIKNGWIKPVNERIELKFGQLSLDDYSAGSLYRDDLKPITREQLTFMEQAINGERFTKEDMIAFAKYYDGGCSVIDWESEIQKWFNDWLKDR